MPPLNAGARSAAPIQRQTTVSPAQLAAQARQRLAQHLPADRDFQHSLESHLHLHPFRGIVTAVNRNATTNQVKVRRTGQVTADANWYDVFGNKQIAIVGDEVLLQYLAGSATAMVTLARKGGRPDEQDVPYSGGSMRRYDSNRHLTHKHGDDHHTRQYDTDGATISHHLHATGAHKHTGDHYHNVSAGLNDDGTTPGGATWHKHTHASGRYEHHYADGTYERTLRHHSTTEHGLWFDDGGGSGTQLNTHLHLRVGSGGQSKHKQHGSALFHLSGDDGTGLHFAQHAGGSRLFDSNGVTLQHYAGGTGANAPVVFKHTGALMQHWVSAALALEHTGSEHRVWLGGANAHHKLTTASTGGKWQVLSAGGAGYHEYGDDGTGNVQHKHASGNLLLNAGASTTKHYANGAVFQNHDGSTLTHTAPGGTHNLNLGNASNPNVKHVSTAGASGGQAQYLNSGGAGYHQGGDDGAGALHALSQGSHLIKPNSGASGSHKHTTTQHIFPSAHYIDTSGGTAYIDIYGATGAAGVRHSSHSVTTGTPSTGGFTIQAATASNGVVGGTNYNFANLGSGSNTDLHFKIVSAQVYQGTLQNIWHDAHGSTGNMAGWGWPAYYNGAQDGNTAWSAVATGTDGSISLYGARINSTGALGGWNIALHSQVVN